MLTFRSFTGIDNVLPPQRLSAKALVEAMNVDLGLDGEVSRRAGYDIAAPGCHKNLWRGAGFHLATIGGQLTSVSDGGARHLIHPALSSARVAYCNLPDGRTAFSNGAICGLTDGLTGTSWGVPAPTNAGFATSVQGGLDPGLYRYAVTHVRVADGLESAPVYGAQVDLQQGGLMVTDLPEREGMSANVYLTGRDGGEFFLAGSTAGAAFIFTGVHDELQLPCRTLHEAVAPAGQVLSFWRGRALVAVGDVLYASLPYRWESFHLARDFKRFAARITLVQPVDDGLYVGTEDELVFLLGDRFDTLAPMSVRSGRVVPGSGCAVPGERLRRGDGMGSGAAMVCIVAGHLTVGFRGGETTTLANYRTQAREVVATFREVGGTPQYLAVEQ